MKNIPKFEIHPLCYIVALIYIITGTFRPFLWISLLIIVHELGHVTAGLYFKWNIEKVVIMPMGGITIFKESLNRPIKEEFIIAITGPIFQILFYLAINQYVSYEWFKGVNYAILLFNMFPIIPLDGSKILHCIMDSIFTYQISHKMVLSLSIFLLCIGVVVCFYVNNLMLYIMFLCLVIKVTEEYKISSLRFQKFLLERYLYTYRFPKTKKIKQNNITGMYRDYNHLFFMDSKWVSERKVLQNYFER